VKDASGAIALVTSRIVNELNRVTAVQGSVGQATQIGYDANGVPISTTDPLNQTTRQTVDGLRRTTATTFADNTSATQTWNQLDQLTQVKDPKDVATQYTYNAFGEVLSETSPDIGTIRYTRDGAGQVTQIQDAKGLITHMERDALGRLKRIQYAANHEANFTYDQAGYVSKVEDKSGSTTYERDAQGRITAKIQRVNDDPANPSSFAMRYAYTNGELSAITYPSGLKVTYNRVAGRITGIDVQAPGKDPVPFVSALTHTALGQPKSWSWYNGDSAARTFDTDGRMTGSEIASYVYDAAGRITGITQQLIATRSGGQTYRVPVTWSAGYDNRNRLVSFVREGAETRYSYDANSNRLTAIEKINGDSDLDGILSGENRSQSNSQVLNVEGTSNRLLGFTQTVTTLQNGKTASVVTTPVTYSIDANGAMTSDGLRIFDYDESGRLAKVRVTKNGEAASITYLHNAMGQRVFKGEPEAEQTLPSEEELGRDFVSWLRKQFGWLFTQGNTAKTNLGQAFVYGDVALPGWALAGEYDNGGASGKGRSEYIWLPTEEGAAIPIGLYRGGKLYAIHSDHLGTPRLITDEITKPVWQWPYSAFGNNEPIGWLTGSSADKPAVLKGVKPLVEVNLRFPGQYFDVETGLNQNWNREYNARQGRYTQFDPIGLRGGINGYAYVGGSPLMFTDPLGLKKFPVFTAAGGAGLFGPVAGEGGLIYLLDPCTLDVYAFTYVGGGLGLGFGGALTSQVGVVDADSPMDITAWGASVSGFAAAGHGAAFNVFGSGPQSTTYTGGTGGHAAGGGAGVAGMISYTWHQKTYPFSSAPKTVQDAFKPLLKQCGC
jgi:RHS repeat-associated protein